MAQRLYPQCQSCWQLQGSAVRQNFHKLIYHNRLRMCHFAPFVALISMERDELRLWTDSVIDCVSVPIRPLAVNLAAKIKKIYKVFCYFSLSTLDFLR